MQFWILYYVCCDEEECHAEQKAVDHVEGVFATREAVDVYLASEWGAKVPLFENKETASASEFPCYFLHKYDTVNADGTIS